MATVKDSVQDLKAVLKREKAKGRFKGNFSKMRKMDLLSAVTQLGFAVSVGGASGTAAPKRRGRPPKAAASTASKARNPLVYDKSTGVYVKAMPSVATAAAPKRRGRPKGSTSQPKMFGPSLARGMTYKRLAESYAKAGNTQLANVLPLYPIGQPPPNRPLPMLPATMTKKRKQRKDKGQKRK